MKGPPSTDYLQKTGWQGAWAREGGKDTVHTAATYY